MKKSNDNGVSKKKIILLGSLFVFVLILIISGLYFLGGRVLVSSDQGVTKPTAIIPRIEKGTENFSEIVVNWAQSLGRNPDNKGGFTNKKESYENEQLGFQIKYPGELVVKESIENIDDYRGSISFWENEASTLPAFEIDAFLTTSIITAKDWVAQKNDPVGVLSDITDVEYRSGVWVRAIEVGDPDHLIYVKKYNDKIYKLKTTLIEPSYIKDVLDSFK